MRISRPVIDITQNSLVPVDLEGPKSSMQVQCESYYTPRV